MGGCVAGDEADLKSTPRTCFDPMYGPAVRRKRFCRSGGCAVLHQCIRPLVGACVLRATMDISARAISLADRPRTGHSGHQCSHAPGRPILHLVSSSRRPRRETGGGTTLLRAPCLCSSFVRAVRPFLRPGVCLFPGHRAQGPSRLAVALGPASGAGFPGHALTTPGTVPRLSGSGRHLACLDAFEVALFVENRPGDASQLVRKRDRQHVVV